MECPPELIITQLQLEGIIQPNCVLGRQMLGTTEGKVYVVNLNDQPRYILKMDAPMYIKIVTNFLQTYKGVLIPRYILLILQTNILSMNILWESIIVIEGQKPSG
jgi:hypothetical protein